MLVNLFKSQTAVGLRVIFTVFLCTPFMVSTSLHASYARSELTPLLIKADLTSALVPEYQAQLAERLARSNIHTHFHAKPRMFTRLS